MLTIQVDSREKARAIKKILAEFERQDVIYYTSKLYVGDYMSLDNPRLIIDRKQNLSEVCANVCQGHERFRNELIRAKKHGIKLIILIEHSNQVKSIDDVADWINPRRNKRVRDKETGKWKTIETKAMKGETLAKIMRTMERKYGCEFMFCSKEQTGQRIIKLLGGEQADQG